MRRTILPLIGSLSLLLALPTLSFAADSTATEDEAMMEDILNTMEEEPSVSEPIFTDGKGGGTNMIYPGPTGGIQVETSVTREVTPDFIALNAYCDIDKKSDKQTAREALQQLFLEVKKVVGSDGVVRRSGAFNIYPLYDQNGQDTGQFNGNMSLFIRIIKPASAQRIFEYVDDKNCSPSWDVRLVDAQKHEMKVIDELASRLQKRKAIFEKLLGRRLTQVVSASLYTWIDGYNSYDPEKNTAEAMTTLSVSFHPGNRAMIQTPQK